MSDVGWIEWKCPDCGSPLEESEREIACAACGRSWPVEQRIPLFLPGGRAWLDGTEWADSLEPFFEDEASDHWLFWSRMRAVFALAARRFEGRARPTVLDVGCGTGYVLSHLSKWGARTAGVEITPEPLRLAQRRDPRSRFVCAPSDRLPFRDDQFDLAISLDVYEHIEDELPVVKETFRVLAPGGWHLVFVPAHPCLWSRTDRTQGHFRRYHRTMLRRLLEQADFEVQRSGYLMPSLVAPAFLVRKLNDLLLSDKTGFRASSLEYRLPPRAINRGICGLLSVERWITLRLGTPFGITAYALARKPG